MLYFEYDFYIMKNTRCMNFGCLDIRSVNNKLDSVVEVRRDLCIDLLFLVETRQDQTPSASAVNAPMAFTPSIRIRGGGTFSKLGKHASKRKRIYIAPLLKYLTRLKALRYGSHSVTCKLHRTCLYLVSNHQMAHPRLRLRTSNCSLLLIYLPRKDERLSWPRWLVT